MIFWIGWKNCIVKNEKCIVFPESRYINPNPDLDYKYAQMNANFYFKCSFALYFSMYQLLESCLFLINTLKNSCDILVHNFVLTIF